MVDAKEKKPAVRIDISKYKLLEEICEVRGGLKKTQMLNVLIQEEYNRLKNKKRNIEK